MTDGQRFTQELPVELTAEELRDRSAEMASQLRVIDELELQKKQDASDAKQRIDKAKRRLAELGDAVRTKAEPRDVECVREHDYRRGEVITYRTDTGERVSSRPMSVQERQQTMAVTQPIELPRPVTQSDPVDAAFDDDDDNGQDAQAETQSVGITRELPPDDFSDFS